MKIGSKVSNSSLINMPNKLQAVGLSSNLLFNMRYNKPTTKPESTQIMKERNISLCHWFKLSTYSPSPLPQVPPPVPLS